VLNLWHAYIRAAQVGWDANVVVAMRFMRLAGTDYTTQQDRDPGPRDAYAKPNSFDNCWYSMSKFRPLYPEYKDLSDKELSYKLYASRGVPIRDLPNLWVTFGVWAGIAFGIPLVVLILGSSLVWAFSGFAAKRS
jgi:hypothetical protein